MTKLKKNPIISLLLVVLLVFTMLPTAAFAAELPDEHICADESCAEHEHEEEHTHNENCTDCVEQIFSTEIENSEEDISLTENETPTDTYSGTIDNSNIQWSFNPDTGMLLFTGAGGCPVFSSAEDQPWKHLRSLIREAWFFTMDEITVENFAHWFEGCTALERAEIPYNTLSIGKNAFANCPSLRLLMLYYSDTAPAITEGAFFTDTLTLLEIALIPGTPATRALYDYDWTVENRAVYFSDIYGTMLLASGYCNNCKGTHSYTVDYEPWTDYDHCVRHWCSNCGLDQCGGVNGESHTMRNGTCTKCGYSDGTGGGSGGGGGYTCYHYSTYTSWSGCNWYEYCRDCGAYLDSGTSHGSTYTTWSGCDWYEYCRDCGKLMDSGTSHSSFTYGAWEYYSSTQHRRYGRCSACGEGSYSYARHSTTTKYTSYSATQHQRGSYCSTCGSYVGTTTKSNHTFTYGTWTNYNGTQHRRTKSCATCGYSEYEYANHSLTYNAWTTTDTQHNRTVSCSCGYTKTETANHSFTYGSLENYSDIQHRQAKSCAACGYSGYDYAPHTLTEGDWQFSSEDQHRRVNTCECGYSTEEYGDHTDADGDDYCDFCGELMKRFSVTLPANLSLVVSKDGEVYAATTAQIINNSSNTVRVFGVELTTENDWTLAPYTENMANAKVNSKAIGFRLNDLQTTAYGDSASMAIPYMNAGWRIPKNTGLPLNYDAVVTATSEPISEQVLTITFIIGWFVD